MGDGKFKKGQSGNLLGTVSNPTLVQMAKELTGEAVGVLRRIMHNRKATWSSRVSAAAEILSRGHGKPAQPFRTEDSRHVEDMSDADLIAALRVLEAARAGQRGATLGPIHA